MTRTRTVAGSRGAARAQTRALATHRRELTAQLREELGVPPAPAGRPALIMLMGFPGVGKTHVARMLAERLGAAHVATDEIRSRLFIAPTYAPHENATVFAIAEALVDDLLGEGHRVVLDATHLAATHRAPAERVARARAVPLLHVLVTSEDAAVRERLETRTRARAADDHSDADVRIYERMRARGFEPPAAGYLEVRNGAPLAADLDRVILALEGAT